MHTPTDARVVVIGASPNPERYAFRATQMLVEHGYAPVPVGPREGVIAGRAIVPSLAEVTGPVDTVSLYLGPDRQADVAEAILALKPRRIIFNPGTENPEFEARAEAAGVEPVEACTLVLLRTNQF